MEDQNSNYLICISYKTNSQWFPIQEQLCKKHKKENAKVLIYNELSEILIELKFNLPKYVCFIALPIECTKKFVKEVHILMRSIEDHHPYYDCIFGILTGPDIEIVQKIINYKSELLINKLLAGTKLNLIHFDSALVISEIHEHKSWIKKNNEIYENYCPSDTTHLIVEEINKNNTDLIITSGHATEKNWDMGFCYKNGKIIHDESNKLYGLTLEKEEIEINSLNPKVYLGVGNCLIGNILPKCMALSWMKSGNAIQFAGYTVPTWYGFAGWGILKYFMECPLRYTINESFFANQNVLINTLLNLLNDSPDNKHDIEGLEYDRDQFMVYGDPKTVCKINKNPICYYKMNLIFLGEGKWKFEVECLEDCIWISPCPDDRSVFPGRPPFWIFEKRMNKPEILEGNAILTSLFILLKVGMKNLKGDKLFILFQEKK